MRRTTPSTAPRALAAAQASSATKGTLPPWTPFLAVAQSRPFGNHRPGHGDGTGEGDGAEAGPGTQQHTGLISAVHGNNQHLLPRLQPPQPHPLTTFFNHRVGGDGEGERGLLTVRGDGQGGLAYGLHLAGEEAQGTGVGVLIRYLDLSPQEVGEELPRG